MRHIEANNFTDVYNRLIEQVMEEYDYECSPRDMKIREVLGASFTVRDPRNRLPYIPARNFSISYYVGELLWYLCARDEVEWIAKYSPFWLDVTDDGKHSKASYGRRLFTTHESIANGRQVQWNRIIEELKNDRDSRRAVVYFGQPADHTDFKLDVGCTTATQFFIRDDKLHQIVTMRSNDLILGTPYDVAAFTMFQELLALELGVELGSYTHRSNSLHIYERNFPLAQMCLDEWTAEGDPEEVLACPAIKHPDNKANFDKLYDFEGKIWSDCNSPESLRRALDRFDEHEEEDYWRDWACVLAAHRSKKLTDNKKANREMKKECFGRATFDGYRRFRK